MSIADQDRSRAAAAASGAGAFRRLLRHETTVNAVLVAVMVCLVWGCIGLHLRQQRAQAAAAARRDSANLAQAAAASISQAIASVDDALRFMRAIYLADPKHFDIGAWTNRANQAREVALEFALIDRDGNLLSSSLPTTAAPGEFAVADFFVASAGHAEDRLLIGQPLAGRASDRWSVPLTRRVTAADGWFIGILVAAVDPSWLTRLHRALDTGRGALIVVGADGVIRALALGSAQDSMHGIGMHIDLPGLVGRSGDLDRGTLDWTNPVDGTEQVVSYQRLAESGAYVMFGLDAAEAFAPYRVYQRQYEMFGAGLTLLILLTGCLLMNNTHRLLRSRELLRGCMDAISQGIVMVDRNGRMPVMNRRAGEILRIAGSGEAMAGSDRHADIALLPAPAAGIDGAYEQPCADGTVLEINTHPLAGGAVVRTYADITERKRAEELILHLAMHDSLTGLPNRRLLTDRLAAEIITAREGGAGGAVLLFDLDRFKTVNETRGHAFGNRVLLLAADRLRGFVGDGDVVARIAGDEFCVLLPGLDEPAALATRAAALMRLLSEPVRIEDREILLSISVGVACYPHDGSTVDALLTRADMALLRAKEGGRATFRIYEASMDAHIAERRQLEVDLRNAMTLGQLTVFYQPIFAAAAGGLVGFEALLRWFHPTRGAIPPNEFLPVAEECGLVMELGSWVLQTACAEAVTWPVPLRIAVNLSPRQFCRSDFADRLAAILNTTGLPPERLTLEVTESVLIDSRERAQAAMSALRQKGVRTALDDFGTGYSSLSYLHRFAFDSIKIDRCFIGTLSENPDSQAIVRAILTLGRSLRMKVVAKGVETPAQQHWLQTEGCDELQGFLLGRPVPAQRIGVYLAGMSRDLVGAPMSDPAA